LPQFELMSHSYCSENVITDALAPDLTDEVGLKCVRISYLGEQPDQLNFPSDVSGVLLLECLHKSALSPPYAKPHGRLVFRGMDCSERDNIIESGVLSCEMIACGKVEIEWFSFKYYGKLIAYNYETEDLVDLFVANKLCDLETRNDICMYPWFITDKLRALKTWDLASHIETVISTSCPPLISDAVREWKKPPDEPEQSLPRHLTPLEKVWIIIELFIRLCGTNEFMFDRSHIPRMLDELRISETNFDRHIYRKLPINANVGSFLLLIGAVISMHRSDFFSYIMREVKVYVARVLENVYLYEKKFVLPLKRKRRNCFRFPLYSRLITEKFVQNNLLRNIPEEHLKSEQFGAWLDKVELDLNTTLTKSAVYDRVLESTQVTLSSDSARFCVYNLDEAVFLYRVENMVTLQRDDTIRSSELHIEDRSYDLDDLLSSDPGYSGDMSPQQRRAFQCFIHRVPMWGVPCGHRAMNFFRIMPANSVHDTNVGSLAELISTYMYPRTGGKTSEFINGELHCPVLVLDLDVEPPMCVRCDSEFIDMTIRDARMLLNWVYDVLLKPKIGDYRRHMIFLSGDAEECRRRHKIGIHQHLVLPSNVVLSVHASSKLVKILNLLRHSYPKSLGLTHRHIYDSAIFPKRNMLGFVNGHLLRGPYQSKPDGGCSLNLRYDSGGGEEPLAVECLVHGYPGTAQRGRVISDFILTEARFNEDFFRAYEKTVAKQTAKKMSCFEALDMLNTINSDYVLTYYNFEENKEFCINQLQHFLQRVIYKNRDKIVKYVESLRGEYEQMYAEQFRFDIRAHSDALAVKFCSKSSTYRLCYFDSDMPHCLRRPHRKGDCATVHVLVGYFKKSKQFALFQNGCFKSSCSGVSAVLPVSLSSSEHLAWTNIDNFIQFLATWYGPKQRGVRVIEVTVSEKLTDLPAAAETSASVRSSEPILDLEVGRESSGYKDIFYDTNSNDVSTQSILSVHAFPTDMSVNERANLPLLFCTAKHKYVICGFAPVNSSRYFIFGKACSHVFQTALKYVDFKTKSIECKFQTIVRKLRH